MSELPPSTRSAPSSAASKSVMLSRVDRSARARFWASAAEMVEAADLAALARRGAARRLAPAPTRAAIRGKGILGFLHQPSGDQRIKERIEGGRYFPGCRRGSKIGLQRCL